MSEMYQKAIRWLKVQKEKAQVTAEFLQGYPEAADEMEAPAVIEWIMQQIAKSTAEAGHTSVIQECLRKVLGRKVRIGLEKRTTDGEEVYRFIASIRKNQFLEGGIALWEDIRDEIDKTEAGIEAKKLAIDWGGWIGHGKEARLSFEGKLWIAKRQSAVTEAER